MGFIELFFVVGILLVLYFTELIGPQNVLLWIIVAVATAFIVFLVFHVLTKSFGLAFLGEGSVSLRKHRRRLKIQNLLRQKQYGEAEDFLTDLLRRDPSDNEASRALCEIFLRQKRYEEFITEKERYLKEGYRIPVHEKAAAYHRIADLYIAQLHNLDRALMVLNQIILDFPDTKEATFARKRMNDITERMRQEREDATSED
jgi:tetratricopeptide (TPR) repeat protein